MKQTERTAEVVIVTAYLYNLEEHAILHEPAQGVGGWS